MKKGAQFLSDLVLNRTYAATKPDGYKESTEEVIDRVLQHHVNKYPQFKNEILKLKMPLLKKQVIPAMRWMQFAGEGIKRNNVRGFNCSYTTLESFQDFAEIFFILMCGTGVGYSVRRRHVDRLPVIRNGHVDRMIVEDTKESWADSICRLLENPMCTFDYSLVRAKGELLSTGGTASGPGPLRNAHELIRRILWDARSRRLTSLEAHDIVCIISDAVVVGGVRRAALISIFDPDDEKMLTCKHGSWWEHAPWRARANNSAALLRANPHSKQQFERIMQACFDSNAGEPGVFWTNDEDWGTNPCAEIALRPKQFCNLTEVNVAACKTPTELLEAIKTATILGTLQASYTDFPYLNSKWRENTNEEALLGVSLTGLAENWGLVTQGSLLKFMSYYMKSINKKWAALLGVNPAARIGCVKPSGTASAYLGTTSGIHAAHSPYYLRRVRIDSSHPVCRYLADVLGPDFIEDDVTNSDNKVITIPIESEKSINRTKESSLELLERAKYIQENWIQSSHRSGKQTHNVSLTVSYKPDEWESIIKWMWDNKDSYAGISLLPYSDHVYQQAPFEEISKEQYDKMIKKFPKVDFTNINYVNHADDRHEEAACAGGSCELT